MLSVSSKERSDPAAPVAQAKDIKWGPTAAVLFTVASFLIAYVGAGLLAYILPKVMGWGTEYTDFWFNSVAGQFTFVLIAEGLMIGSVLLFLRHRKTTIRALGFRRAPEFGDVWKAVVGYLIYFAALILVTSIATALVHLNMDQKQELGFDTVVSAGDKIMTFISLVILPPLAEETLFRGFLFTGLRQKFSFWPAAIVVSVIFASLHLAQSSEGILWVAGIDTLVLSVILCWLREKTGNLWAGIFVHAFKNGIAFVVLYVLATT